MSKYFGFILIPFIGLLLALPLACSKTYTSSPVVPTATPTVSPTPTCYAPPQSMPCSSGIMWGFGQIVASSAGNTAELLLAVNCVPYTSAAVTLTGPGMNVSLTYYGTMALGGTTYADYNQAYGSTLNYVPGDTYTMTSITASGTAYASLVMPPAANVSSDGFTVTWAGASYYTLVGVSLGGTTTTYESSTCWSATSPWTIPSSAYPSSGTYYVGAECTNYTTSITGGNGIYYAANQTEATVSK